MIVNGFDYRSAQEAEIMRRALYLVDKPLSEFTDAVSSNRPAGGNNRGGVGAVLESYFGIPKNNSPEPDFLGAGIELKAVPLVMDRVPKRVKERTTITGINFMNLVSETWATASVRKKLRKVLFIYHTYQTGAAVGSFHTIKVHLWNLSDDLLPFFRADWEAVWHKVRAGRAHEISESDGRILGASSKGAGKGKARPKEQPYSGERAKSRAWALKPAFTWSIFRAAEDKLAEVSIVDCIAQDEPLAFEERVLRQLHSFVGLELGEIQRKIRAKLGSGKARGATLLRRSLGLPPRGRIREFEQFGIEVKTVPMSVSGKAYESMSFPAFRHLEVQDGLWEDSDLLSRVTRILVMPVIRPSSRAPVAKHWLGRPFFWSPSPTEMEGMRTEWEMYRDLIRGGRANALPGAKLTEFLHVRTKGVKNGKLDEAPLVGGVKPKGFYLNAAYTGRIVTESSPGWIGRPR